jgi:CRISPR-associated protein Csb2
MLAVAVELLTGRYVATAYNTRGAPEWPPHPARLFSALAATHLTAESPTREERDVLEWLETLGPPAIQASDASHRDVATVFVPVNDAAVTADVGPQYEAVEAARAELAAAEARGSKKDVAKSQSALTKATKKLQDAIQRSTAAPAKLSKDGPGAAMRVLPEHRSRMARTFPSVTPEEPRWTFVWPEAQPSPSQRVALDSLLARLVRVGHSSSLVAARVIDDAVEPRWRPTEGGQHMLRTIQPGQLAALQRAHTLHQETEPRIMPARFQSYSDRHTPKAAATASSVFDEEWLILKRVGGPALPMVAAAGVARAIRGALMAHASQPVPEVLSGHSADRRPSERPHLAIVPLAFIGHARASGSILGVALVLPREVPEEDRRSVYRAVHQWEAAVREEDEDTPRLPVRLGALGALEVERVEWGSLQETLRGQTWCRASRIWLSATPVALDRNPGDLRSRDTAKSDTALEAASECIRDACTFIGLPAPSRVEILPAAPLAGAAKARLYPRFPSEESKLQRVLTHVRLEFAEPVRGPVLLGAGRYVGLGLFRPEADGD